MIDVELTGVIDLHVHAGPDLRPRKMDALELARAAREAGMRALLFKNHHAPTVIAARLLEQAVSGLRVFGGIALNGSVGGLNPAAVETAIKMGAAEIWLPTLDAAHERQFRGQGSGKGLSVIDESGGLCEPVHEILRLVAESRCILGLGHLSFYEMKIVVREALRLSVDRILVNHPEINFLNLPVTAQQDLAAPGVYFERCYVRANQAVNWDGLAQVIRAVGAETSILATDLGQPDNVDPVAGMKEMIAELSRRGFTRDELMTMTQRNPARLLGLE
jgi:Family of unknown function (DUF6282)